MLIIEIRDIILDSGIGITYLFQSHHGRGITIFNLPTYIRLQSINELRRGDNQNLSRLDNSGVTTSFIIQKESLIYLIELSTVFASLLSHVWCIEINTHSNRTIVFELLLHRIIIKGENLKSNPVKITHIESSCQLSGRLPLKGVLLICRTKLIGHIFRIGISENHALGRNQLEIFNQLIISTNNR